MNLHRYCNLHPLIAQLAMGATGNLHLLLFNPLRTIH